MSTIITIFKKEMLDTLRDKRTVIIMILLPLLVFPLIMTLITKFTISQEKKAVEKIIQVAYIDNNNAKKLSEILHASKKIQLITNEKIDDAKERIKKGKIDFLVVVSNDFDEKVQARKSGNIQLYYKISKEVEITKRRIWKILQEAKTYYLGVRLKELNLDQEFVETIKITEIDLASIKEKIGEYAGGILPYLFILFCFFGAMYPAIDLAAGEKERYTIETLLASPASRIQIVLGKFLVVFTAGLTSAVLAILGLFITIKQIPDIPVKILETIVKIVEPNSIILMFSLLIPLCVFFAATLLSISIFANSFKEAQSIMTPMNFLVIIPAMVGMLPGVKLSIATAFIPILNISLATKDIISGNINSGLLVIVYVSMFTLAAISLYFCSIWFKRESVIFRGI